MLFSAPDVRAGSVSTQGMGEVSAPEADGSTTGDINTATSFTLGNLQSTTSQTGFFTGMASTQNFLDLNFTTTNGTSLSFGNDYFGHFASSSISVVTNVKGYVDISISGYYTAGTFPGSHSGLANLNLSFTQVSPAGSISDSGTLSVVPEPASLTMGLTSIAVCGLICGLRRRRTSKSSR
jgi:hypothetical protein